MNIIDIIIASLLLFSFVRGFMKGFFIEIASLIALIAGVYGAINFSHFLKDWLIENIELEENYISLIAFAGTFIVILLAIIIVGKILTKIADSASLGILNRILGGVFGLLKIGVIMGIAFFFFEKVNNIIPFIEQKTLDKSILYGYIVDITSIILPSII
ncbi:MAG: CvpA family protein [Tenacibaculum sp.]|nr:CvpA family protein [Tenacibaculum sp.]